MCLWFKSTRPDHFSSRYLLLLASFPLRSYCVGVGEGSGLTSKRFLPLVGQLSSGLHTNGLHRIDRLELQILVPIANQD